MINLTVKSSDTNLPTPAFTQHLLCLQHKLGILLVVTLIYTLYPHLPCLFSSVCPCPDIPVLTFIYLYLPLYTYIYPNLPVLTFIYLYLQSSTSAKPHLPTFTLIYQSSLVSPRHVVCCCSQCCPTGFCWQWCPSDYCCQCLQNGYCCQCCLNGNRCWCCLTGYSVCAVRLSNWLLLSMMPE